MTSYFDRFEEGMLDAVERRTRAPWYRRVLRTTRMRTLAVVLAALVVATPAVGAASGWFNFGQPNVPSPAKPGVMYGLEKPGSSRLLPLRVADPQGGPPWGLRIVKTSRGDTCVQLGRVENGQLGSLGIDGAWNDDHQFHAISVKDDPIDECGSTDAAGYGYVNRGIVGQQASVNVPHQGQGHGSRSSGCVPTQYAGLRVGRHWRAPTVSPPQTGPSASCSARAVFLGLLGPDAVSVTYRRPGGGMGTERTVGGVGAYLLVFPYDKATCHEYADSPTASRSCPSESMGGVSPTTPGAITKITYKDGHSCSLAAPSGGLEKAYEAFVRHAYAKLGRLPFQAEMDARLEGIAPPPAYVKWEAGFKRLLAGFLAREHLTAAQYGAELATPFPSCPAVGWVASTWPKVTASEVRAPIHVREFAAGDYGCPTKLRLPQGCNGVSGMATRQVPFEWSFTARRAVTRSRSWYEWVVWPLSGQRRTNCGGSSFATYTNIHQGQVLRYSDFLPTWCRGRYEIVVGYTPSAPPRMTDDAATDSGLPGEDGSLIVGRASFTIR